MLHLLAGETVPSPGRPSGPPGAGWKQDSRSSLTFSPRPAGSDPETMQPCRNSGSDFILQGEAGPSQALFGLSRIDPIDLHEQAQIVDPMPVELDPVDPADPADLPAGPSDTDAEPDQWPDIDVCRQAGYSSTSVGSGGSGKGRAGDENEPVGNSAVPWQGHSREANGGLCLGQAWMGSLTALSGGDGAAFNGLPGHRHSIGGTGRLSQQLEPCSQNDRGRGPQQKWGQQREQRRLSLQHQPTHGSGGLIVQPRDALLLAPQQPAARHNGHAYSSGTPPAAWWAPPSVADVAPGTVPLMHSGDGLHTLMLLPALPDSWR